MTVHLILILLATYYDSWNKRLLRNETEGRQGCHLQGNVVSAQRRQKFVTNTFIAGQYEEQFGEQSRLNCNGAHGMRN